MIPNKHIKREVKRRKNKLSLQRTRTKRENKYV